MGALDFAYDLTELGRYHRDYQALMAHWRAVLPASHFLEVDYEAVVEDIEAEARRMLDFLGLPWDPACLDFIAPSARVNRERQSSSSTHLPLLARPMAQTRGASRAPVAGAGDRGDERRRRAPLPA